MAVLVEGIVLRGCGTGKGPGTDPARIRAAIAYRARGSRSAAHAREGASGETQGRIESKKSERNPHAHAISSDAHG